MNEIQFTLRVANHQHRNKFHILKFEVATLPSALKIWILNKKLASMAECY